MQGSCSCYESLSSESIMAFEMLPKTQRDHSISSHAISDTAKLMVHVVSTHVECGTFI